jgi:phosphoribosylformylglycinamidine synthase II
VTARTAVAVDTVAGAAADGAGEQPYRALGLTEDEYRRIRAILGRRPTACELAMYAVMWSEHCSYKSSRVHLRRLADTGGGSRVLAGIGANAGAVAIGEGLAVAFKVESHNHPSYVEPYQGAATGVGGIVRDVLAMGARPVAVMDSLRFGDPDAADTRRLLAGVVAGISGYGNCLGLPNIGGEVVFDPSYGGNPLVNALCLGVVDASRLQQARAAGPGNRVVLLGARTGPDGIGGVSVLASAGFEAGGPPAKRPSVQIGDPFTEKLLIECCLELFASAVPVGVADLGGAGLTCALSEMASRAGTGLRIRLDRVPLRDASMQPVEVLTSESQERMLLVVAPERMAELFEVCARWGVSATDLGAVTGDGRVVIDWHGSVVADVPPASLADDGPVYRRPLRPPADAAGMRADRAEALPRPASPEELRRTLLTLAGSANLCSRRWVTEQYDRYVLGRTVLSAPHDAGVVRVTEDGWRGVAISVDGNGRYTQLDPYLGTQVVLAEAYRNVAATGARPVAVTNCLNFGSPEEPEVMWQFAEAVRGLADGCRALDLPVTGGNVSFYNQTGAAAIHPTPVVGVLGVLDDVRRRLPLAGGSGEELWLAGTTREELSGSEWAWVVHRHLGGEPPAVDLAVHQGLASFLARGATDGWLSAAHDLADGGLAQTLVEVCLAAGSGAEVALPADQPPFVALFSESTGRVLVSSRPERQRDLATAASEGGLPVTRLGRLAGSELIVAGLFAVPLAELLEVSEATLPRLAS